MRTGLGSTYLKIKHNLLKLGSGYQCSCCGSRVTTYNPLPEKWQINATKYGYKYLGRGEMTNMELYKCPSCGADDRARLYALFFRTVLKDRSLHLLDIAPSRALSKFFDAYPKLKRRTCDLHMEEVDDNANIEDLQCYGNDMFDALICSHVLEHVEDPDKALKELYRVLKPDGFAILMVPICMDIDNTIEDPCHDTPELRWRHYGQDNHLRLFARNDFINRIRNAGFHAQLLDEKHFGRKAFKRNGLKPSSTLYLGWKQKK